MAHAQTRQRDADRAAAHRRRKADIERVHAMRAAVLAADHYLDGSSVIGGYTRTRHGKAETVRRFYRGMGPRKRVPDLPLPRLRSYLLAHGVAEAHLTAAYLLLTAPDGDALTTHDLIDAGLLTTGDYFDALDRLPNGTRF